MTPHRAYPARRSGDDRPEDVPEDVLIALARNRDEAAVRELVRRCNRQLFRAARAILHDDAEAEDVVQAAYVTGFTRLDEFRGESGLATWLTRIAMNEAYARLRRRARIVNIAEYRSEAATHPDRTADTMTSPPETPEFETGRNEVRRFLERAIDALPEPLRLTYMLRDVQDMPTREVAAIDMQELEMALTVEDLAAEIDFNSAGEPVMPEGAANDGFQPAPAVRAVDATLPPIAPGQSSSVLVGVTREHLKRRQAA